MKNEQLEKLIDELQGALSGNTTLTLLSGVYPDAEMGYEVYMWWLAHEAMDVSGKDALVGRSLLKCLYGFFAQGILPQKPTEY
jgi:hypothetical protein